MKYPRTYHLSWSKGATSDDRVSHDVTNLLNRNIIITEKIDGSNTSITKDGVFGRSHADFTENPWDIKSWDIWNLINNDLHSGLFIFGEGTYGIHSIEYTQMSSYFYIFGIRDNDVWLSWDEVEEYSYLLNIPTVPILFKGVVSSEEELKDITEELSSSPSHLGGIREGIVVRSSDSFSNNDFKINVLKQVRPNHVTTDEHWTRNWRKAKLV